MKGLVAIIVFFLLLLPMIGCGVYDGAFMQAEYQIKFVTQDGKPIDGVQLEVVDESGNISYGFPVTDYYEGGIPTSDANGVVIFHHVMYFLEWGGPFFCGCAIGSPPEFDLLFTKNGGLVYETEYIDLDRKVEYDAPTVTRTVSVYDEESAGAVWSSGVCQSPRIVEDSLEFLIFEQTVVVENQ